VQRGGGEVRGEESLVTIRIIAVDAREKSAGHQKGNWRFCRGKPHSETAPNKEGKKENPNNHSNQGKE